MQRYSRNVRPWCRGHHRHRRSCFQWYFGVPFHGLEHQLTLKNVDLVGISDEDTWEYSAALMDLAASKGFRNIKLVRIMDLLGLTGEKETTKEIYLETVTACRKELESQFGKPDEAVRDMIQTDPDTLLTYRGFIRFLETDLKWVAHVSKIFKR